VHPAFPPYPSSLLLKNQNPAHTSLLTMPLFGRSNETAATTTDTTYNEKPQRHSMFGRHRSPSPDARHHTNGNGTDSPHRGGLLHRNHEDSSITQARERVMSAEAAERDADRALLQARSAVKQAREHVKHLEREAAEEARLAKIKQNQAKSISKRAKPLGRHDRV